MSDRSAQTRSATSAACSRPRPRRFAEHGPGVSVDEIARRAGVGHGDGFPPLPDQGVAPRRGHVQAARRVLGLRPRSCSSGRTPARRSRSSCGRSPRRTPATVRSSRARRAATRTRRSPRRSAGSTTLVEQLVARAQEQGALRARHRRRGRARCSSARRSWPTQAVRGPDAWRRYVAVVLDGLRPPATA